MRAVLDATVAELAQVGYAGLRLENVASRAQVNKTTVYRRWPTRADLVRDVVRDFASVEESLPDTGNLRDDLFELVTRLLAFLRTPTGQVMTRMLVMERSELDIDRLTRELRDEKQLKRAVLIDRAKARGELPPDVPASLILDCVMAPVMSRTLRFNEDVPPASIRATIDLVVTGAEHGGGRAAASPPPSQK